MPRGCHPCRKLTFCNQAKSKMDCLVYNVSPTLHWSHSLKNKTYNIYHSHSSSFRYFAYVLVHNQLGANDWEPKMHFFLFTSIFQDRTVAEQFSLYENTTDHTCAPIPLHLPFSIHPTFHQGQRFFSPGC